MILLGVGMGLSLGTGRGVMRVVAGGGRVAGGQEEVSWDCFHVKYFFRHVYLHI